MSNEASAEDACDATTSFTDSNPPHMTLFKRYMPTTNDTNARLPSSTTNLQRCLPRCRCTEPCLGCFLTSCLLLLVCFAHRIVANDSIRNHMSKPACPSSQMMHPSLYWTRTLVSQRKASSLGVWADGGAVDPSSPHVHGAFAESMVFLFHACDAAMFQDAPGSGRHDLRSPLEVRIGDVKPDFMYNLSRVSLLFLQWSSRPCG